jgi:DNA-binding transcriptional LysR family regulator
VIFRYDAGGEDDGVAARPLLDEPSYLVTSEETAPDLAAHADAEWIAGCDRCRIHLLEMCAAAGFSPRVSFTTDDFVAVQALVAAGLGVTTLPGLPLKAARNPAVHTVALPGTTRHVLAATYGEPPEPPATAALLDALGETATRVA